MKTVFIFNDCGVWYLGDNVLGLPARNFKTFEGARDYVKTCRWYKGGGAVCIKPVYC